MSGTLVKSEMSLGSCSPSSMICLQKMLAIYSITFKYWKVYVGQTGCFFETEVDQGAPS
jgi:hypothetical protein